MTCAVGRNTKKYGGTVVASTLQDVTENGNTTTLSIQTDSFFIGDGSLLTNLPGTFGYGNLEQVTASGNTTTHEVTFENTFTSLEALGNVVVVGNVTALTFYGDGANLTGIVTLTDFEDNVSRIVNLESNLVANSERIGDLRTDLGSNVSRIVNLESNLVANSERIGSLETEVQPVNRGGTGLTSYTVGDILYASATDTLSTLSIGAAGTGNVLTIIGPNAIAWEPPSGGGGGTEVGDLQAVTTNGDFTSVYVKFTNTFTSLKASGNVLVDGNVTALTYYGDGSNLTGLVKVPNFESNVSRIINLESNLVANSVRITNLESNLVANSVRITNLESNLVANSVRITNLESNLVANSVRITNLDSNLLANALRITNLDSNLLANALRITNLESNLVANSVRITNLDSNLLANALRITNLETSNVGIWSQVIVSNSSTITTGFSKGDLLYASLDNQLSRLALGTTEGHVLTANATSGLPEWKVPTGGGTTFNNITEDGGNTGISNVDPQYTLQVGSNVIIDDVGSRVVYVRGSMYSTGDVEVLRAVRTNELHAFKLFIKNTKVVAEKPTRVIRLT